MLKRGVIPRERVDCGSVLWSSSEYNYILQPGKNKSYDIRLETRNVVPHTTCICCLHTPPFYCHPPNEGLNGFAFFCVYVPQRNEMPTIPNPLTIVVVWKAD